MFKVHWATYFPCQGLTLLCVRCLATIFEPLYPLENSSLRNSSNTNCFFDFFCSSAQNNHRCHWRYGKTFNRNVHTKNILSHNYQIYAKNISVILLSVSCFLMQPDETSWMAYRQWHQLRILSFFWVLTVYFSTLATALEIKFKGNHRNIPKDLAHACRIVVSWCDGYK